MDEQVLDDVVVDAAEVSWVRDGPGTFFTEAAVGGAGDAARALRNFLTVVSLEDAWFLAEGVAGRETRATEMAGYSFAGPDGAPLHGLVRLFDGMDREAHVSEAAFHRLLARLVAVLVEGAERTAEPATQERWWPEFRALAAGGHGTAG